jgi:hypothetical protein
MGDQRQPTKQTPLESDFGGTNTPLPTKKTPLQEVIEAVAKRARERLLPQHHADRDFFLADLCSTTRMKDDGASMEAPIFTLSTQA